MRHVSLNNKEFSIIQRLVFKEMGITLNDTKKSMVENRLLKRLKYHNIDSFTNYMKIVELSEHELTEFLNCISTNETYFFREELHFKFLTKLVKKSTSIKAWSAAASFGAEAYTMAMILNSNCKKWEIFASDINTNVLNIAKQGLYQISLMEKIPRDYQEKYCLIGRNDYEGKFLIDRELATNIIFNTNNLIYENKEIGMFDIIFLRNVLLYFTEETKIKVVNNVIANLKVGGYLFIGLTEYFKEENFSSLKFIENGIYRKVQNETI